MTTAGWIVMLCSVGSVLTLAGFCLYRVLTLPPAKYELGIDTGDDGHR